MSCAFQNRCGCFSKVPKHHDHLHEEWESLSISTIYKLKVGILLSKCFESLDDILSSNCTDSTRVKLSCEYTDWFKHFNVGIVMDWLLIDVSHHVYWIILFNPCNMQLNLRGIYQNTNANLPAIQKHPTFSIFTQIINIEIKSILATHVLSLFACLVGQYSMFRKLVS